MLNSSAEILAPMDNRVTYDKISQRRAKHCYRMLKELLNNDALQFQLVREFSSMEKGYPVSSHYPEWAYEIAANLYAPPVKFGRAAKEGVVNICQALLDEFESDDRYFARTISSNNEIPFLTKLAQDLLGE